jgi:uncharacterized pyridoxal phosphate-containing UPF0001 family protein
MEIVIDSSKKISVIQKEFEKRFPYLKIDFYKQGHAKGEGSRKENTWNTELTIKEVQKKDESGIINIHGLMTVAELESAFFENYGLSAQVFRKSGKVWLQTTATDNWTLAEQNQKAMEKHEILGEQMVDSTDRQELE